MRKQHSTARTLSHWRSHGKSVHKFSHSYSINSDSYTLLLWNEYKNHRLPKQRATKWWLLYPSHRIKHNMYTLIVYINNHIWTFNSKSNSFICTPGAYGYPHGIYFLPLFFLLQTIFSFLFYLYFLIHFFSMLSDSFIFVFT